MSAKNKYIVTWDIFVNSQSAVTQLNSFTTALNNQNKALKASIKTLESYNKALKSVATNSKSAFVTNPTSPHLPNQPSWVTPNPRVYPAPRQPSPPKIPQNTRHHYQKNNKRAWSGLPMSGLMMGLLAYGSLSANIEDAFEYDNLMTSAKAFLKTADDDLSTFEGRFDALATNVRNVGKETKFTATEVAGATKFLAMAGMQIDSINKSIRPIANLALIGDEDIAKVADLATNIMTGYGIGGNEMGNVSDIITNTMTRSNVSISEIAESFKMSAGYLSSSGINFSEATGAIGVLGDAGMKATLAGTALRAMMIRFAKPTRDAQRTMDKLGVSFTKNIDVMGEQVSKVKPLVDIFEELRDSGASLEDLQRIFGTIGGNSALQLINRTDKLRELTALNRFSHGTAEDVADEKKSNIKGRLAQMSSAFKDSFLTALQNMSPQLVVVFDDWQKRLSSPEFTKGLESFGSGILMTVDALVKLGSWVAENWSWLQPLVFTKVIHANIMNLGSSLFDFGKRFISGFSGSGGVLSALSAVGLSISGILASITVGVGAFVGYSVYAQQRVLSMNEEILNDSMSKLPNIGDGYDKWTESLLRLRDGAIDANGAVKILNQTGDERSVKDITGMSSDMGAVSAIIMGSDTKGVHYSEAFKQIKNVAISDQLRLLDSYTDFVIKLNPSSPEYLNDLKNAGEHILGESISGLKVNEDLYKTMTAKNYLLEGTSYYKDNADPFDLVRFRGFKSGSIDQMTLPEVRTTQEYFDEMANFGKNFTENMTASVAKVLSSQESAKEFVMSVLGDSTKNAWMNNNFLKADGTFNETIPESKIVMEDIRDNINQLINISKDAKPEGLVSLMKPKLMAYVMNLAGLPEWSWSATPVTGNLTPVSGVDGGGDDKDVKNRGLNSHRATPKQVIVNLDNLMKIDSVTINQDNQEETLNDLKIKITQILTDVVADFDSAYHG